MPHKRAKRSVREKSRQQIGSDIAPSHKMHALENESVPKSMLRVLDAARIRAEWKGKRKAEDDGETDGRVGGGGGGARKKRKVATSNEHEGQKGVIRKGILPGESLAHFNRRVEDDMRPLVRSAMQLSTAHVRKALKTAQSKSNSSKEKDHCEPDQDVSNRKPSAPAPSPAPSLRNKEEGSTRTQRKTEFATTSSTTPKRLNDIALAPPSFQNLPRGAQKIKVARGGGKSNGAGAVLSMAQKRMMEVERENAIRRYRVMKEAKTGVKRWDVDAIQAAPEG